MDTAQKDRFRKLLLEQRDQIVAGLDCEDPAENQDLRDPEDFATVVTSSEVNDQLLEDDLNLLEKIDLALSRLDDDTYEQCAGCGRVIPMERLRAKPSVSLCVPCQEEKDAEKR